MSTSEPYTVTEGDARQTHPIDRHLEALLLRQRGHNGPLVREVLANLSSQARERLFRLIQELEQDANSERSKRRRGLIW